MPTLFMTLIDGGRICYYVWVLTDLCFCNYTVIVCFLGGLFNTPYALEEPSLLLIYYIFYSSKKIVHYN